MTIAGVDVEGATEPGTVQFPPGKWIPNDDQISDSAGGLLAVAGRALDGMGIGKDFERRIFTHGVPTLNLSESKHSQLMIYLKNFEIGRAGAKQFSFDDGELGKYAFLVPEFEMQIWTPWATPTGGLSAKMASDESVMQHAYVLNKCLFVVFAALRALSQGGIRTTPPVCPVVQDHMLVGPATPLGPDGSFAGWSISIQLEY